MVNPATATLSSRTIDLLHEHAEHLAEICPFELKLVYATNEFNRYQVIGA